MTTPTFEPAVVGAGLGERRDAADDVADVADEHAAGLALEPAPAVDLDACSDGVVPSGLDPRA